MKLDDARDGMCVVVSGFEYPATGLVEYVFPLRKNQNVRLILPRDLTMAEVKRLEAFMLAIAVA